VEGVAEGYAEREIGLTLQVVPNGAPAPSTDIVNVTVTPVLQTLTVTRSSGNGPPAWQVTPSYVPGTRRLISNGGQNVPANTPTANMSATALNTNLGGQLNFIQNVLLTNNLNNNTVGAILDTTNKVLRNFTSYVGMTLIDCNGVNDIPFYIVKQNVVPGNGVQTVSDQDTPSIGVNDVLPMVMQKNDTQVDFSQKFTFYAVWKYPDNTYWPLGQVTWSVRYYPGM